MIGKIRAIYHAINDWGDYTQRQFVIAMNQLETFKQLAFVLAVFGIPWLLAWYGHTISPWLDSVLGTGPHDPDSYGKIVWRRMWSSAFCGPFILYALIKFTYNQYISRKHKVEKSNSQG